MQEFIQKDAQQIDAQRVASQLVPEHVLWRCQGLNGVDESEASIDSLGARWQAALLSSNLGDRKRILLIHNKFCSLARSLTHFFPIYFTAKNRATVRNEWFLFIVPVWATRQEATCFLRCVDLVL